MKLWIMENKRKITLVAMGLVAVVYFTIYSDTLKEKVPPESTTEEVWKESEPIGDPNPKEDEKTVTTVMVDIKGAIKKPGVYVGRPDERVKDLIERAGGLTEHADQNQVNFSAHISDEMVIFIPIIGEENIQASSTNNNQSVGSDKVNLNTADETELLTLPGIGPSKAASIIEYRNTSGPFKTVEDLKNISGIGDKTFEKLKDSIFVP